MKHGLLAVAVLLCSVLYAQKINEVCPSNVSVYEHEEDEFPDWVEFYNDTDEDIDLSAYYFSNDSDNLTKWQFPDLILEDGEVLVIPAEENNPDPNFISFSLGRKGGAVYLSNASGVIIDSVIQPTLQPNHSYGLEEGKWFFYENPTPNQSNSEATGYKGYANQPIINRASGSYSTGTNIVIRPQNENETIYYSLNGINPLDAFTYDGPVILDQTISMRVTAISDSMISAPALYRTYFVGIDHELPIVHLNLDSLEMWDEIVGIYVLGPDAEEEYPFWGANFWKDIEIHAFYEYFDTDLTVKESLDCGIKIHGGTVSTTRPMKSLRLVAHDRYEKEEFTYPYFSNKPVNNFKRLLLRNSGSDFNVTHVKDGVLHDFVLDHDVDIDVQAYEPVIVYINGMYWGIHNLREKLDRYYSESNYQVDPETVNLLEEEELYVISGDSIEFTELRDYALENDLTDETHYNWVGERLDLNSMVDYFIMELYMNNRDWPYNNLKLWNSPEQPRWRYFYSDLDAGVKYYGTDQINLHSLEYILGPFGDNNVHVAIFKKLLENPEFNRYFINRYADLLNTIFEAEYIVDYVYEAKSKLDPEMQRHFFKWWGQIDTWNENFLAYDNFFNDRVAIVQNELSVVFEKEQAVEIVTGMYPSGSGTVTLNTLELDEFPFIGNYYPDNRIDLTINPEEGKTFLYWENLRTGEQFSSAHIQIDPTVGDTLIAVFEHNINLFNLKLYPVPLASSGTLEFSVPESGPIEICLFGLDGRQIMELEEHYLAKGSYQYQVDLSSIEKGNYFITLKSNSGKESIPLVKF